MNEEEYEKYKSKFLHLYADVAIPLRKEIIAVVDNETISWNVAYADIKQNENRAKEILVQLKKIGLFNEKTEDEKNGV